MMIGVLPGDTNAEVGSKLHKLFPDLVESGAWRARDTLTFICAHSDVEWSAD
jgi:hypothetical protein